MNGYRRGTTVERELCLDVLEDLDAIVRRAS